MYILYDILGVIVNISNIGGYMIRKFLMVLGCFALAAVLLGLAGYHAFFKPDLELQQELKAEFGEEFFEINDTGSGTAVSGSRDEDPAPPDKVYQKDNIVQKVVKGIEKMAGTVSKTPAGRAAEIQPVPVTAGPDNAGDQAAPAVLTQAEILGKYEPRFLNLQAQSAGRLETLYASALAERQAQKANGTFNREDLAHKYIQAGSMVESAADSQFYNVLNDLQAELAANGLPTDIIAEIEGEYLSAKSGKRSELLDRAGL
jgi:hypothetical protein